MGDNPANSRMTQHGRFYEWEGVMYPSVTTILSAKGKPAGLVAWLQAQIIKRAVDDYTDFSRRMENDPATSVKAWLRQAPEEAGQAARDRGTALHRAIETGEVPDSAEVQRMYGQFQNFMDDQQAIVIGREFQVWNTTVGYVGTADALLRLPDGSTMLVDWKTSREVQMDHLMQVIAYMGGEFATIDGELDTELTATLQSTMVGGVVKIATDGWTLYRLPYNDDLMTAWCGLVAFVAFDLEHGKSPASLTRMSHGSTLQTLEPGTRQAAALSGTLEA